LSTTEISPAPNGGSATRDIAVVGAGLVGLAAALAFAEAGLDVVLLGVAMPPPPTDRLDSRIYAISPGSAALIDRLGAWRSLPEGRVQPVNGMAIRTT
jgi:2-polyprenyl-6-methoxyphenol hydroxylase-like FAD-dependent oxidoreductase